MRVIGPTRLNWNDADAATGHPSGALGAGAVVLRMWAVVRTAITTGSAAAIELGITDGTDAAICATYAAAQGLSAQAGTLGAAQGGAPSTAFQALMQKEGRLYAKLTTATAGAIDVFAEVEDLGSQVLGATNVVAHGQRDTSAVGTAIAGTAGVKP